MYMAFVGVAFYLPPFTRSRQIQLDFIPTCIVAFSIQIFEVWRIIFRAKLRRHTLFDHPGRKLIFCTKHDPEARSS